MKTVNCEGVDYLAHEAEGNAARWIMPLAQYYCKGVGVDIGYSKDEWKMPGAYGIDNGETWNATNIPIRRVLANDDKIEWDFIFSSHCLEHVAANLYETLDHWVDRIKVGGILFLYLPHASQNYWQPRNNRKHVHSFTGHEIEQYLKGLGHQVFVSGVDMNHSFTVICEKREIEPEFGSEEYYDKKAKVYADEREAYCQERNISYIREGNNVIYNDISYGTEMHKTFFEQNTEDLAHKIADMRMQQEFIKPLSDFNVMDLVDEEMALKLMNNYGKANISFGNITNDGLYPISAIRR